MTARPPGALLAEEDVLELEIEKLVSGGEGMARFRGVPIFVPRSAPGDRLRARLVERRPQYGRAEIVEILVPGPDRRDAPCPLFDQCGGCQLQHIADERQSRLKAAAAREALERLGGVELPAEVPLLVGEPWAYRSRAQFRIQAAAPAPPVVGYFARRSHRLVPVGECPILVPELNELLRRLPGQLPPEPPQRLDVAAGSDGGVTCAPVVELLPRGAVTTEIAPFRLRHDARTFFQAHRGLLSSLVETAVGEWQGETAADLFCGVGLFSLPLSQRYERVVGVDGDRIAARYARNNARANGVKNLTVETAALASWAARMPAGLSRVLVDPPRAGLPVALRSALRRRPPRRLTYVSCHDATLARDLSELDEAYDLDALVFLDLFPQTSHLEIVVQLRAA